jgi:hypothetical protein
MNFVTFLLSFKNYYNFSIFSFDAVSYICRLSCFFSIFFPIWYLKKFLINEINIHLYVLQCDSSIFVFNLWWPHPANQPILFSITNSNSHWDKIFKLFFNAWSYIKKIFDLCAVSRVLWFFCSSCCCWKCSHHVAQAGHKVLHLSNPPASWYGFNVDPL